MSAVTTAAGKLAASALQRAGSMLFQKLLRLHKIDRALQGISESPVQTKALHDYKVIKGTWKGQLTENLDAFLGQLENTGLIKSLMDLSLSGRESAQLQEVFVEFYLQETGGSPQEAKSLFAEIKTSFDTTVTELCKDPILLEIIKGGKADTDASLDRMEQAISAIKEGIQRRPSQADIESVYPRLARALQAKFKHLTVETNQGPKEVEINKIYIPPNLTPRTTAETAARADSVVERVMSVTKKGRLDFKGDLAEEPLRTKVDQFAYADIIRHFGRIVILGDPGGGKSTLCQRLCYSFAQEMTHSSAQHHISRSQLNRSPFRIVLREFERARATNAQLTLFDYLINDLLHSVNAERAVLAASVEYLLSSGCAIVAFDGLDEILKTALRRQFVSLVVSFSEQYPLCPVLVTSRLVGYDKAPLPSSFDELVLDKFDDNDVKEYAVKFLRAVARKKVSEARASSGKFMIQSASNAEDLRKNPLMLGLMMWIFNIRGDVPSNRPEIYQECARLMFERWDSDRGISVDLPQTFDRLQIFSFLASRIFVDEELAGGVSAEWIEQESRAYLSDVLESRSQAHEAARRLIDFIVGRAWVMSEKGEGVFSFTHQTFLEYFFAKHLDDNYDTVEQIVGIIVPKVKQQEWDVVSQLALQIKTYRNRRKQDEAMRMLVSALADRGMASEERLSILDFCGRCLEFLIGSESAVRAFLSELLRNIYDLAYAGVLGAFETLESLTAGARERREFASRVVAEWVCEEYSRVEGAKREVVVSSIDGYVRSFGEGAIEVHRVASLSNEVVSLVKAGLQDSVVTAAPEDLFSACRLFEWFGSISPQALDRFGLTPFYQSIGASAEILVDGLAALALANTKRYHHFFDAESFLKRNALESLKTIGSWASSSLPLNREEFPSIGPLNNPPEGIWVDMLASLRSTQEARWGALVAAHVSLALDDRVHHRELRDSPGSLVRASLNFAKSFSEKDNALADRASQLGRFGPFGGDRPVAG